jgi:hypothetical protein
LGRGAREEGLGAREEEKRGYDAPMLRAREEGKKGNKGNKGIESVSLVELRTS